MSEQKTLFTNEQLLVELKNLRHCLVIGETSIAQEEIQSMIDNLERAMGLPKSKWGDEFDRTTVKATVEQISIDISGTRQLVPTILEGLPNLNRNDFPYSLPDHLEDAFGISHWTDRTWGEMIEGMGYVEYPIHAPMSDEFRKLGKEPNFRDANFAFHKLFPVERFDEIRKWAKEVYGWDCEIIVSIEPCIELTYDALEDEEVNNAWGYLFVGPHVPKKRDKLPSQEQQDMLQCVDSVLPMGMELAPYGDENSFLEWLVCGIGEWICVSETGNVADHVTEIEYIKQWWLARTGTRMENIKIDDSWEDCGGIKERFFSFTINREDIQAVYGHLELPKAEVDRILHWAEQEDWADMPQFLGWFGKTIEDEPVKFGPSNVDGPVESIMDQIDRLNPKQLDMLLERIHAEYNVGDTLSSMVRAVVKADA